MNHQPYFKALGPKDHTMTGFWAILRLRVRVFEEYVVHLIARFSVQESCSLAE